MRYRQLVPLVVLAAGCSHELTGPKPAPATTAPALACNEQLTTPITIGGAGLSPLVTKGLEDAPRLELPKVLLTREKDMDGNAASGAPITIRDDAADPASSRVAWASQSSMTIQLTPDLALEPGLYAVTVTNATGASATLPGSLLAVPRPHVTKVEPQAICSETETTLVLTGDFFLTLADAKPEVAVGTLKPSPTLGDCRALPGNSGASACRTITITVPKSALTPDAATPITVTNPAPAACRSTDASVTLLVVPPPTLTGVAPAKVCTSGGRLTLTGTGIRPGSTVTIGAEPAASVNVTNETTAEVTVAQGLPAPGPYEVTLTIPEKCSATATQKVTVVDGAQLFFLDPPVVYSGIALQATAYGSGLSGTLQKVELVGPTGTAQTLTTHFDPNHASRLLLDVPAGLADGDYAVRVLDDTGCEATLQAALRVVSTVNLTLTSVEPPFGWNGQRTGITLFSDAASPAFKAVPRVYLTPAAAGTGGTAQPLSAVNVIGDHSVTAVLPANLAPGAYRFIVVNPDGALGVSGSLFTVTGSPNPMISAIAPTSIAASGTQTITLSGSDFRSPKVDFLCTDAGATGGRRTVAGTVTASSGSSITATLDTTTLSALPTGCTIQVTNQEAGSPFVQFAALVVTNPAEKLGNPSAGKPLATARRALGLASARLDTAQRYLFAVGGDDGTAAGALDSVDGTAVNLFGEQAGWTVQRHALTTKRSHLGVAALGRFVYAVGGTDGTKALATVERAALLDPDVAPEIEDLDLVFAQPGEGLDAGVYYYRVSAILGASDAFNPDGETLASERFPVSLPNLTPARKFQLTVHWRALPGAVKYRIYRSPQANAGAGAEQLVGTVDSGVLELKDTGVAVTAETPLPLGSLGTWHAVGAMQKARQGLAVAFVQDAGNRNRWYLQAIGGLDAAGTALNTSERLQVDVGSDGAQATGTWTASSATFGTPRWRLGAWVGTQAQSARIPAGKTYVWVGPGLSAAGGAVGELQAAELQGDGSLGNVTTVNSFNGRDSYAAIAAGNFLYAFSGGAPNDTSATQAPLCASGVCPGAVAPQVKNWSNATGLLEPRYLAGGTLEGATIYLAGGAGAAGSGALTTTEQLIW